MIKGILFDKDGTLIDFENTYGPSTQATILVLANGDGALSEKLAAAVDFDLKSGTFGPKSVVIHGTFDDIAKCWLPLLPDRNLNDLVDEVIRVSEEETTDLVTPMPGLLDNLQGLVSAGIELGVATNDTEVNARLHCEVAKITDLMSEIFGYDSGHGGKPEPGMVLAFANNIGAKPNEIMMIGDSLHDLHAATAAGSVAVGVTTGPVGEEVLSPSADYIISDLGELLELVTKHNNSANIKS